MKLVLIVLVGFVSSAIQSAIPEHKIRVVDKPLSDEEHYKTEEDDSEEEGHNVEYDHEAFLGKDEAKTFDQLTPEESKEKLAIIFKKIDKDEDGLVSEDELINWIKYVQNRYVWSDTERQWADHQSENATLVTLKWDAYKTRTYGHIDENEDLGAEEGGYNYRDMMRRDQRRWTRADQNGDNELSKEEFSDFLHPEDADHMKDVIIEETLEDIDKNKDGQISLEEYIGDMWPNANKDDEEPEWVKTEREQFSLYRDKNKDGFMDRDEVKEWILPTNYDHSSAEARHLIHESDGDRDGSLSVEEVLDKYDIFVGSQATDFGEALTRHDEF